MQGHYYNEFFKNNIRGLFLDFSTKSQKYFLKSFITSFTSQKTILSKHPSARKRLSMSINLNSR